MLVQGFQSNQERNDTEEAIIMIDNPKVVVMSYAGGIKKLLHARNYLLVQCYEALHSSSRYSKQTRNLIKDHGDAIQMLSNNIKRLRSDFKKIESGRRPAA